MVGERGQHLYNCLRLEHILANPVPISSDVFSSFGRHGADAHNHEARLCTHRLVHDTLPLLAQLLTSGSTIPENDRDLLSIMKARGINTRYAGVLRVQVGGSGVEREALLPPRTRRIRTFLLMQMVVRVTKQLLRHALRQVCSNRITGVPETLDIRLEVLRWCLNVILAPTGPWELPGVNVDEHIKRTADNFWRVVLQCFIELKYSAQSPALSSHEKVPSFDARTLLRREELFLALCDQLGVRLNVEGLHTFRHEAHHAGVYCVHMHDPHVLPRAMRMSRDPDPVTP